MNDDLTGHGIRRSKIVGRRHAIDEHPGLIAPRHGLDHMAVIGDGHLPGELIETGLVIEAAM
jgi:hypothetical protein